MMIGAVMGMAGIVDVATGTMMMGTALMTGDDLPNSTHSDVGVDVEPRSWDASRVWNGQQQPT
jgi:hypothetical protein